MDKRWTFVIYGIIFWILGVVMIRLLHPFFYGDLGMHIVFLLIAIAIAPTAISTWMLAIWGSALI